MKLERHNGKPTSAGSRCFVGRLLFVVVSLCVNRVMTGELNQEEFRQVVSDMKADINAGRTTSISSDGREYNGLPYLHLATSELWKGNI